ncbi:hypothetical protein MRB53_039902 [Persea americana]|nr:hypothetical protein MRB53_039902 [Persea americana]
MLVSTERVTSDVYRLTSQCLYVACSTLSCEVATGHVHLLCVSGRRIIIAERGSTPGDAVIEHVRHVTAFAMALICVSHHVVAVLNSARKASHSARVKAALLLPKHDSAVHGFDLLYSIALQSDLPLLIANPLYMPILRRARAPYRAHDHVVGATGRLARRRPEMICLAVQYFAHDHDCLVPRKRYQPSRGSWLSLAGIVARAKPPGGLLCQRRQATTDPVQHRPPLGMIGASIPKRHASSGDGV